MNATDPEIWERRHAVFRSGLRNMLAVPVLALLVLPFVLLVFINRLNTVVDWQHHSIQVLLTADRIEKLAIDMETGLRGFQGTGARGFLQPYESAKAQIDSDFNDLLHQVADNREQVERAAAMQATYRRWAAYAEGELAAGASISHARDSFDQDNRLMDRFRATAEDFRNAENKLLVDRTVAAERLRKSVLTERIAVIIVLLLIVAWWVRRQMHALDATYERLMSELVKRNVELRDAQKSLREHADRLEVEVAARTAELQDTIKELETFSYSVSHDLRSPLRTIMGFGEILSIEYGEQIPPEAKSYVERMIRAGKRMDALITSILEYSRISRGELQLEAVAVEPLVRDIFETLAPRAPRAQLNVVGSLPNVRASRTALQQSLGNLIGNALKFSKPGVPPVITVRAEQHGALVRLWIEDNGIGIAHEDQAKIWDMFHRLNASYEGSGVGLSIVRRAIERMGGEIGVESAPGEGSRFWIQLPRA